METLGNTSKDISAPAAKKSKLTGTFHYKTSFSMEWEKMWPFVALVAGNPHSFQCTVCDKTLSCGHQGVSDVKDHIAGQRHQKLVKTLATQPKLSFPPANPLQDKVSQQLHAVCLVRCAMQSVTLPTHYI